MVLAWKLSENILKIEDESLSKKISYEVHFNYGFGN